MRKVKTAAIQMQCSTELQENLEKAEKKIREAAAEGANIILLPELLNGNISVSRDGMIFIIMQNRQKKTEQYRWECVWQRTWSRASDQLYEKEVNNLYNSIACIDADGRILGIYRKTHIPDDHYYQENFILRRAILDFASLRPDMERSASESAGISGSRRLHSVWL